MLMRGLPAGVAIGVALAGFVLWRTTNSRRARWVVAILTAYGAVAFAHATLTAVPLRDALAGRGLFAALPYVLQGAFLGAFVLLPLGLTVAVVRAGIPRFREGSPRRLIYQAVALTLAMGLVLTSTPAEIGRPHAASSRPARSTAERLATLEKGMRAIEDGERESPRDRWDPQYVVDRVGTDDTALFTWVRENTFWVPYHGLLRGAAGVLMDSLGNSLDRSVLLATLLHDAGFTVRLAHAELSAETAMALLPRLTDRPFTKPERSDDAAAFESDVRAAAAQYQLDASDVFQMAGAGEHSVARVLLDLQKRASEQTDRLKRLLTDAGVPGFDRTERVETAVAALRDHWWVQRQNGTNWIDLDVDAPSLEPGKAFLPAAETVELKDAAVSRSHEVVVRVIAERTRAGASAESTVFEYTLRPADVLGQPIVLQFWPMDWPPDFRPTGPDPKQAFRKTVLAQHEWDATLVVGSTLAKRGVVSDAGEIEDARATSDPFGSIAGAFSKSMGLSKGPAGQELTAVWIEYETHAPGQPDRKTRRAVFDVVGPAARAAKKIPSNLSEDSKLLRSLSLMMRTEILPQMCRIAPEYLAHLLSDSVLKNRNLLPAAVRNELGDPSTAMQTLASKGAAGPSPLYELAIARFDLNPSQDHLYIDRPAILSRHTLPVWRQDGVVIRDATDIVANDVGVDLLAADSFSARLQQGVIDTNVEQLGKSIGSARDTGRAFAASSAWVALPSPQSPALRDLNLPDDAKVLIDGDLESGHAVVAPQAALALDGEPFVGWWRVDLKNGQALGIGEQGWGTSMTERGLLNYLAARWAPEFVFQYALCLANAEAAGQINRWWLTGTFDPIGESAFQNWQSCSILSFITAGVFVTLPFLTAYLSARLAMPGGLTAGFTLWLRSARGRLPKISRARAPKARFAPPRTIEPPPKPSCDPAPGAAPEPPLYKAPPGPKAPHYTIQEIEEKLSDASSAKSWAESVEKTLEKEAKEAAEKFKAVDSAYRQAEEAAYRRGLATSQDPVADALSKEWDVLNLRNQLLQDELAQAQKEVDLLAKREAFWRDLLPADARLIQAEEQLNVALRQQDELLNQWAQNPKKYATCEPGSPEYKAIMSDSQEIQRALEQYQKAVNEYYDVWLGRSAPSPSDVPPTVFDRGPNAVPDVYSDTQPQFPQVNVSSPPPPSLPSPSPAQLSGLASTGSALGSK